MVVTHLNDDDNRQTEVRALLAPRQCRGPARLNSMFVMAAAIRRERCRAAERTPDSDNARDDSGHVGGVALPFSENSGVTVFTIVSFSAVSPCITVNRLPN